MSSGFLCYFNSVNVEIDTLDRWFAASLVFSAVTPEPTGQHAPSVTTLKMHAHSVGWRLNIKPVPDARQT